MRNRTTYLLLDTSPAGAAAGASAVGRELVIDADCDDLHLVFGLEVSAATLVGDVTLRLPNIVADIAAANNPALLAGLINPLSGFTKGADGTAATGVTLDGTVAKWTFASPPIGTIQWSASILYPPPTIQAVFTFTSGGGNVRLRTKAVY